MSIINLIAAFGGGAFAASIGALPAFIMTQATFLLTILHLVLSSDHTSHSPVVLQLQHTLRKKVSARTVLISLQHVQASMLLTF